MSLSQILPESSRPIKTKNTFLATFNTPTTGKYNFSISSNTGQIMLALRPKSIYFLERVNFSMDIIEGAFHQGYDTDIQAAIRYKTQGDLVYGSKIPFYNYLTNFSIHEFAGGLGDTEEFLTIDLEGTLNQVPKMDQVLTIRCFLSWSIYQIIDDTWRQAFQNKSIWKLISGLKPGDSQKIIQGEY